MCYSFGPARPSPQCFLVCVAYPVADHPFSFQRVGTSRCDTRGLSKSNASPRVSLCLLCTLVLRPSTLRPSTEGQDRELHFRYTLTRALFVHTCMCKRTCDAYANGCGRIISTIDGIMVSATLSMSRSHPSCKCATHSRFVPSPVRTISYSHRRASSETHK